MGVWVVVFEPRDEHEGGFLDVFLDTQLIDGISCGFGRPSSRAHQVNLTTFGRPAHRIYVYMSFV
jgi:hypothetical protein